MVPEIHIVSNSSFYHFGPFLPFYPINNQKNKNFEKMKKNLRDIIILHKYTKNHDHMLHSSQDARCDGCNFFFRFGLFFVLLPPKQPKKSKFLKNEKNMPGDIIILLMCTKNYDHMMYGS